MKPLPADLYETIDPGIARLCRFINENFPGLQTTDSCQGWVDGHRPGEPWQVYVRLDVEDPANLAEAVESLAYLAWLTNGAATRMQVNMHLNSAPPYLNDPAPYFYIESSTVNPDDFLRQTQQVLAIVAPLPGEEADVH